MDPRLHPLEEKVKAHILNHPDNTAAFSIRMSTAGFCQRQMDYAYQGPQIPVTLNEAVRFAVGHIFHEHWRQILSGALGADFSGAERELSISIGLPDGTSLVVLGHCDGFVSSLDALVEVKSVSDNTFTMVKNQGHPIAGQYEQANIYAYAYPCKNILMIYQNRDTGEYLFMLVSASRELAETTIIKWSNVEMNKKQGRMSPRPYSDMSSSPCWFCDYKEDCYKDFVSEVAAMQEAEIDDPIIVGCADKLRTHTKTRLESEKLEAQRKAELAKVMIERGLRSAKVVGVGHLSLKIGTKNNPLISLKEFKV